MEVTHYGDYGMESKRGGSGNGDRVIDNTLEGCKAFDELLQVCFIRYYRRYFSQIRTPVTVKLHIRLLIGSDSHLIPDLIRILIQLQYTPFFHQVIFTPYSGQ